MATPTSTKENGNDLDHAAQFSAGVDTFSLMFTRWMDTNGWSHPTIVSLAKAALNGAGWLHSSQVSGLRHGKLRSPGPRTFVAIERLNFYLHRYKTEQKLIPNTKSSNQYHNPEIITNEEGKPPELGWWVEVFCGLRKPAGQDLPEFFFTPSQAADFSNNFGKLARRLLAINSLDIVTDIDLITHRYYTPGDNERVSRFKDVLLAKTVWGENDLVLELPALARFTSALGGPETEQALKRELS